jgi:hypothetical protein
MSNILNSPLSNSKRNKISTKPDLPFYETPTTGKLTSSQIIKEAREKLVDQPQQSSSTAAAAKLSPSNQNATNNLPQAAYNLRTLQTNRPFTPRDDKRSLFGTKSIRPINDRPPSAFE